MTKCNLEKLAIQRLALEEMNKLLVAGNIDLLLANHCLTNCLMKFDETVDVSYLHLPQTHCDINSHVIKHSN